MTSQAYLSDLQAVNVSALQQGQSGNSQPTALVVQGPSSALSVASAHKSAKSHTVLQPTQNSYGGQQFIVTFAADNGSDAENLDFQHSGGSQVIYHSQQAYGDYIPNSIYTPVSGTYYQSGGSAGQMSGSVSGQHAGEMYLVHGGPGSVDSDGLGLTHTIRASPATENSNQRTAHFDAKCWQREVQWLLDNYETAEGVSLPRSTLYNHYIRHCQDNKLDPMNPASFGKLIRSVFLGLRTRRLGTRGNSQYHYYGIRIKSVSSLNQLGSDGLLTSRQQAFNQAKRFKSDGMESSATDGTPCNQPTNSVVASAVAAAASGGGINIQQQQQHQQYLGDMSAALPEFGQIGLRSDQLPPGVTLDHVSVFEKMYRDHCEAFLEIIFNLQFPLIETLWQSFWRNAPHTDLDCDEFDQRLPKDRLYALCELNVVRHYVCEADYSFYQAIVQVLIPDVLRPIPSLLTQMIRNFAKNLENWLKNAMTGVPDEMIKTKIGAVSAFAQMLRRYTSLNHLAQAARAVLTNSNQITQMLADINKVDFANVQEQASWVCQCDDSIVHHLEQDFKKTLQQQTPLEQWAAWLEGVVNQALGPYESSPDFPKAARQFLLKWSFYSSMVIRDLTLRSAASFGSFHLIRLLYDEYMFYLVEHKVAAATGETSIAVMGEFRQLIDVGSKVSHGYVENDELLSNHVLTNSQSVATNFHSYSSPPTSASLTTNGPLTANGNIFPSNTTSTTGGVAYFRDAVAHVQSTPGSTAPTLPLQPTHRVILTTHNPSSGHVPITGSRTIVITGPTAVPSHSTEPAVKRVCVE